jgi:transposase
VCLSVYSSIHADFFFYAATFYDMLRLCSTLFDASRPNLDSIDLEAVNALLIDQHKRLTATLTSWVAEIKRLVLLVEKLQRMLFDTKSEKFLPQIEQLELQHKELRAASAVEELQAVAPAERPVAANPFRSPLPEHLPREIHTHSPAVTPTPTAVAGCASWGRMSPRCWSGCGALLQGHPSCAPEAELQACDKIVQASAPSRTIDRGPRRIGLARLCAGLEVFVSLAALPVVRDLCP